MKEVVEAPVRRCRCGEAAGDLDRFCSSCGAALEPGTMVFGVATTTAMDIAGSKDLDRRWLSVAAVVIVGLIGWSVWSGSRSSTDRSDDAAQSTTVSNPTTVPTPSTTSLVEPPPFHRDAPVVRQIGSGEPLLGEATGLRAILVQQSADLSVLDLDTGEMQLLPSLYSWIEPFMVSGDWLAARVDGSLAAFALDDLGAPPIPLLPSAETESFGLELMFPEPRTDGTVWVVQYAEGVTAFTQVDLATGEGIEEFVRPDATLPSTWIRHDVDDGEAVFSTKDGGVYVSGDAGPRRVAEGRLIATDDRRALVQTCDERLRCRTQWLDRATWTPVDLAVPGFDFDGATFVGGTDWLLLASFSGDDTDQWLFDVRAGRRLPLDPGDHLSFEASAPPISPDGRWMALHEARNLVIVDLADGRRHVIEDVDGLTGAMVLTTSEVRIDPSS